MNDEKNLSGETAMKDGSIASNIISWLFGTVAFAIGVVITFWGNDSYFRIFILLLSFVYFLPVKTILNKVTGFTIPKMSMMKILQGILIIWAEMGVGELFDKVELLKRDL